MEFFVLWLRESADGLWLAGLTLSIIMMSIAIGYLIELLWWRRPMKTLALTCTIFVMVGLAHLLPLGRWTVLGYIFAVLATTVFVFFGSKMRKSQRRREKDPHADPANWGMV